MNRLDASHLKRFRISSALAAGVCFLIAGCGPRNAGRELEELLKRRGNEDGFSVACLYNESLYIRDFYGNHWIKKIPLKLGPRAFRIYRHSDAYFIDSEYMATVRRADSRVDRVTSGQFILTGFDVNRSTDHVAYLSHRWDNRDVIRLSIAKVESPSLEICSLVRTAHDAAVERPRFKSVSWVGDRPELIYSDGRNIFFVNMKCEQRMIGLKGDAVAVDPQGLKLAFRSVDDHLVVGEIRDSRLSVLWTDRRRLLTEPRWSADSRLLSMTVGNNAVLFENTVIIRDLESGQEERMRPIGSTPIRAAEDGAYDFLNRTGWPP